MKWKERIDLCQKILNDMLEMIPEECEEERADASMAIENIREYVKGGEFKKTSEEDRETESVNILLMTIKRCQDYLDPISEKMFPKPTKYITHDEAYDRLIEEYAQAFEDDDDTLENMNINEWMEARKFVLVKENDSRRISSSADDSVNSRTKF